MRVDLPDFTFGACLVAAGVVAFALSGELAVGASASMGPGYVPRGLALLVALYGAGLIVAALLRPARDLPGVAWRPLAFVGGAVSLFALMLPTLGLAVTAFAVVFCAGFAAGDARWRENVLLALALAVLAVLLFVKGIGLPMPVWPR